VGGPPGLLAELPRLVQLGLPLFVVSIDLRRPLVDLHFVLLVSAVALFLQRRDLRVGLALCRFDLGLVLRLLQLGLGGGDVRLELGFRLFARLLVLGRPWQRGQPPWRRCPDRSRRA
jgi:hypothetical protein